MAYITNDSNIPSTSSISLKIVTFLKVVGNAFVQAQEARAKRHVKQYMSKSYRPF